MSTDVASLALRIDSLQALIAAQNLDKLNKAGQETANIAGQIEEKFKNMVVGIASAVSAASFLSAIKGAIDLQDNYVRLSEIAGTLPSRMASLDLPARLAGVSLDAVATSVGRLSRALGEARTGDQQQLSLFKALGIDPNDARDGTEVMIELGKTLIKFKDQTVAAAVSMPLLGRGFAELRPFMKQLTEEQELNSKATDEQLRRAKEFNDQLTRLKKGSDDFFMSLSQDLLPTLEDMIDLFKELKGEGQETSEVAEVLGDILRGLASMGIAATDVFYGLGHELAALGAAAAALARGELGSAIDIINQADEDVLQHTIKTNAMIDAIWDKAEQRRNASGTKVAGAAPSGGGGGGQGGTEAEENLKQLLQNQKFYEQRINQVKAFNEQYTIAVRVLNALIEAEDINSVHAQEIKLEKQNQLNEAALKAQIGYLEEQRKLALGAGKTKEANEFGQTIANVNAQIVANETITNAKIRAIRTETMKKGIEAYNQYISGLAQQGQTLVDSFKSRREAEEDNYKRQKDALDAFFADNQEQFADEYAIRERAELEHQAKMGSLKAQGRLEAIEIEKMSAREQAEFYFGHLAQITQAASQHNLALFRLNQVAGIANATISMYVGASKALEWGPILGPVFAGIIIAAGLVNIRAIAQAKFGGGTSAPSIGGGSAIPVTSAVPGAPPSAPTTGGLGLTVIVEGNMIGNEEFINNTLIPALQDAIGNRDVSVISGNSRQARNLTTGLPPTGA